MPGSTSERLHHAASDFDHAWSSLPSPERTVLELAWASCLAGTTGVGAVILDRSMSIIASGCNATRSCSRMGMPIESSYVAHAEINALARIPTDVSLKECLVLTSLMPCVMCAGAMVMAHVGAVRYIGPDPLFRELATLATLNEFVGEQWPVYEAGPDDEWAIIAMFLGAHSKAVTKPNGPTIAALDRHEPEVAELLREARRNGVVADAAALGTSLSDFLRGSWHNISAATDHRRSRQVSSHAS